MTITITWVLVFKLISTILLGLLGVLTSWGALQVKTTRGAGIVMLITIATGVIAIWL